MVVDASVVATGLADDGPDGQRVRQRLTGEHLFAPELLDVEVVSVWRRGARAGQLSEERAKQAMADLAALPIVRSPHVPLMDRVWELRDNLSAYDAVYVALAEALGSPLLTADAALSRAPGTRCKILLLS